MSELTVCLDHHAGDGIDDDGRSTQPFDDIPLDVDLVAARDDDPCELMRPVEEGVDHCPQQQHDQQETRPIRAIMPWTHRRGC